MPPSNNRYAHCRVTVGGSGVPLLELDGPLELLELLGRTSEPEVHRIRVSPTATDRNTVDPLTTHAN